MNAPENSKAVPLAIVFAVTYAVVYLASIWNNYALFTYHPVLGEIGWGVEKSRDGPAMYWYGWMSTAALAALGVTGLAALMPARTLQRLSPGVTWVVTLLVLLAIVYMLRNYFLR
jgi:hypothetical protein